MVVASALLLSAWANPLTAAGYDVLEISPPSGYLTRRAWLADHGVTMDVRYTAFYQGLASGTGDNGYQYGGKMDAFVNFDSSQAGLWEGGGFRSHLEYRHGDAPASLGGAIFPVNSALLWPSNSPEELVASGSRPSGIPHPRSSTASSATVRTRRYRRRASGISRGTWSV